MGNEALDETRARRWAERRELFTDTGYIVIAVALLAFLSTFDRPADSSRVASQAASTSSQPATFD